MNLLRIIYLNIIVSNTGSYLTHLGFALSTFSAHGASGLALVIVAQSFSAFLMTDKLMSFLEKFNKSKLLSLLNLLRAINIFTLVLTNHMSMLVIYSIINSLLTSIYASILKSLISENIPKNEIKSAFRKMSGVNGLSVAISPIIGILIMNSLGAKALFTLDAISYIFAAMTSLFLPSANETTEIKRIKYSLEVQWKSLKKPAMLWCLFLGIGAAHGISEMPYLNSINLSNLQISIIFAAWGFGSLFAFFAKDKFNVGLKISASIFSLALGLAFVGPFFPVVLAGFFVSGFCYSFIMGDIRNMIHTAADGNMSFISAWSKIERISLLINTLILIFCAGFLKFKLTSASVNLLLILIITFAIFVHFETKSLKKT